MTRGRRQSPGDGRRWLLPPDLGFVLGLLVLAVLAVSVPGVRETPLRVVLGLPVLLFVPGYAFLAALFPADGGNRSDEPGPGASPANRPAAGIGPVARLVLSVAVSVVVVPAIGVGATATPWGLRLAPVLAGIAAFTLGCSAIAVVRRRSLPADEQFSVPVGAWVAGWRDAAVDPGTRAGFAVNLVVVASVVLALGSVGYAAVAPESGDGFTEFQVLTQNETEQPVATDYPTTFEVGESRPVVLGVGNHHRESQSYTVVVQLQRVDGATRGAEGTGTVVAREELDRLQIGPLEPGGAIRHSYWVEPTMAGERLRLAFLLYRGEPPAQPSLGNADRELRLWIEVEEG